MAKNQFSFTRAVRIRPVFVRLGAGVILRSAHWQGGFESGAHGRNLQVKS